MARTKDAVLAPEQKDLMEKEYLDFVKPSTAHRTGVQQGLVPLQAHELELEGRLYQLQGPVQPVQGIEGVKDEGEGRRIGPPLHRHRLHHLREVGGQAQPLQEFSAYDR